MHYKILAKKSPLGKKKSNSDNIYWRISVLAIWPIDPNRPSVRVSTCERLNFFLFPCDLSKSRQAYHLDGFLRSYEYDIDLASCSSISDESYKTICPLCPRWLVLLQPHDRPIDHKICGRFNASIYAGVKTTTCVRTSSCCILRVLIDILGKLAILNLLYYLPQNSMYFKKFHSTFINT